MIASMEERRGLLREAEALVLAPGPSFHVSIGAGLDIPPSVWTLACNRAYLQRMTDFLVCIEPKVDPIWKALDPEIGGTTTLVTLPELRRRGCDLILPTIHPRDWPWDVDLTAGDSPSSAWVAAAVAAFMGATRIGVLGVDLVGHPIHGQPEEILRQNQKWEELEVALWRDCEIVNLSPGGALDVLPRATLEEMTS